ncbi:acetyltransferase [Candidatus Pacearchaeota archaeon]|nr:acetyltransferase [Candidatus Pacearchaeota archaeon]|tara:strand:- start:710 stop:1375 length:666 start_codon:yes stop_codon:yes gene_type:complete
MTNEHINNLPSGVVLYGGGSQARIVRPIIESNDSKIIAVIDDTPDLESPFPDIPVYQGFEDFKSDHTNLLFGFGFLLAIGNNKNGRNARRKEGLADLLTSERMKPITIAHETAYLDPLSKVGKGTQIMAGANIIAYAQIGEHCLINTGASIDHDCNIGDYVDIGPQATLCGEVNVGDRAYIGANATVLPGIIIGNGAVVGAGSVVTKDVPLSTIVKGNPAK